MGRLDADRLLHGLGRRRGSDRLARQSRLGRRRPTSSPPRSSAPQYNRPDIVQARAQDARRGRGDRQANAAAERAVAAKPVAAALPPVVTIVSPPTARIFPATRSRSPMSLRSPSGRPIDRLDVLADGQPIPVTGFETTSAREAEGPCRFRCREKDTKVSLIAHSGDLTSAPVSVRLSYDGPSDRGSPEAEALRSACRASPAMTIRDYNTLHYRAHDAEGLAKALKAQKGGLYADVQIKVVDDRSRPHDDPVRPGPTSRGTLLAQHAATAATSDRLPVGPRLSRPASRSSGS